jgi:hypothetical protein
LLGGGGEQTVRVRRAASKDIADRRRFFEIMTEIKSLEGVTGDEVAKNLVDEGIRAWTLMMEADAVHDETIVERVRGMIERGNFQVGRLVEFLERVREEERGRRDEEERRERERKCIEIEDAERLRRAAMRGGADAERIRSELEEALARAREAHNLMEEKDRVLDLARGEAESLSKELVEALEENTRLHKSSFDAARQLRGLVQKREAAERENRELCSVLERLEEANDDLRQRLSKAEEAGRLLVVQAEEGRWERDRSNEALVCAKEEVMALEHRVRVLEGERGALRAREEGREVEGEELDKVMAANAGLRAELDAIKVREESGKSMLKSVRRELSGMRERLDGAVSERDALSVEVEELLEQAEAERDSLVRQLEEARLEAQNLQNQLDLRAEKVRMEADEVNHAAGNQGRWREMYVDQEEVMSLRAQVKSLTDANMDLVSAVRDRDARLSQAKLDCEEGEEQAARRDREVSAAFDLAESGLAAAERAIMSVSSVRGAEFAASNAKQAALRGVAVSSWVPWGSERARARFDLSHPSRLGLLHSINTKSTLPKASAPIPKRSSPGPNTLDPKYDILKPLNPES